MKLHGKWLYGPYGRQETNKTDIAQPLFLSLVKKVIVDDMKKDS